MHFRTSSGIPGVASLNFAASTEVDCIEIVGADGRVTLSVFGNEPVRFDGPGMNETFDLPNPNPIQQPLIQTIVNQLLGRGA